MSRVIWRSLAGCGKKGRLSIEVMLKMKYRL